MFRFKKSIPVDYDRQGYIYFVSRQYKKLDKTSQNQIRQLCRKAGGEHHNALFAYVTTNLGPAAVCMEHFLSESTLERAVKKYYIEFAKMI